MSLTKEQRVKMASGMKKDFTKADLVEQRELLKAGIYHLNLAIREFNGLKHGTDTEDLRDYLEEAKEIVDVLERATA